MPITVQFSRNGFYHPAFGRLGMGDNAGRVYTLPDHFADEGMLPSSAKILDTLSDEAFAEVLEQADQTKPVKPKADPEELAKSVEKAKKASAKAKAEKDAPEASTSEPGDVAEEPVKRRSRRSV